MLQFKRTCRPLLLPLLYSLCGLSAAVPDAAAQAAGLIGQDLPPADAIVEQRLPAYLEWRGARFIDWLSDGSMLIATRFGETEQIHRVREALGTREQLSFDPAGVLTAAAQTPTGESFAYLAPRAGGLGAALLLAHPGGAPMVLTDGTTRDGAPLWAHDGARIAFSSTRSEPPGSQERGIDLVDTRSSPVSVRALIGAAGYRWRVFDWSPDDRQLLVGRESVGAEPEPGGRIAADTELFLADTGSGELRPLEPPHAPDESPHKVAARHGEGRERGSAPVALRVRAARFTPDGHGILLLGRGEEGAPAEFRQLRLLDLASGEARVLSSDSSREVELFDASADGHYLAYTTNEGGASHLSLLDQQRKLDLTIAALPPGIISNLKFDAGGKHLAITLESAHAPRDVYVLEADTQVLTRWTHSELGPLDPGQLIVPALVRFPTWDRTEGQPRQLSAYVYRPAAAAGPQAPHPVLILLRTGAGAQYRPVYEPLAQFLVRELGFVVIAPNVRGAEGYGRSFETLGQGALRDDAARDIGSLLVWIGLQKELDFNHIAVLGEGRSSLLALSCLAAYGDRLRGGIIAFPPHVGPLTNVASVRRPVLLVHGRADPEVPAYEIEQLAARLRTADGAVAYLAASDEAGRFLRKSNRDAYYTAAADFLAQLMH
jgi:dipeptidyl aminopeptidase/acylaminoacyl peptidase